MKFVSLLIGTGVAAAETCKVLVLSGGGSNGAWEAGVFWGLLHYGNPEDFEYNWISGVSAGAINTTGLSGWAKGDEKRASEWLSYMWDNISNQDVWEEWPVGILHSFLEEPSLLNDQPAIDLMTEIVNEPQFD